MTLQDEILVYLHNEKGVRTAGQIKHATSASTVSHFVLLDALSQLEQAGKVKQVSKYNYEYSGNGAIQAIEELELKQAEIEQVVSKNWQQEDFEQEQEHIAPFVPDKIVIEKVTEVYEIAPNGKKVLKVNPELFKVKAQVEYIPRDGELTMLESHYDDGYPLLIEGEKGIAKTLLIRYYCWKNNIPMVTLDCHAQVDSGDLIGHFVLHDGETLFVLGVMPLAIKIANELGACCICFEEFNAMSQEMQKCTNPLLDERKEVAVHDTGEIYRLREGAKLLSVGTMNLGEGYGGIFNLNEECNSRWCREHLEYGSVEHNTKVLKSRTKLEDIEIERLLNLATSLRASEKITFKPCTRELVMFGQVLESYKKHYKKEKEAYAQAFKTTIVNRYSDNVEAYDFAVSEIKSAFGVVIK